MKNSKVRPKSGPDSKPASDKKLRLEFRKLLRLFDFTRGHRRHYVLMFTFLVLQLLTYQSLAYSLKFLINDFIPKKEVAPLLWYVVFWVGLFSFHSIVTLIAARFRIIIVRSMVAGLRSEIIRKLQILAIRYFDLSGTGAMSARLLMDVDKTQMFFDWLTLSFFNAVLGGILVIPFLVSIDPTLTLITVLYIPTIPIVQRIFRSRLLKNSNFLRNTNARLSEKLVDFISGIRHIRLFATEEEQSDRILSEVQAVKHIDIKYSMTMRIFMMVIQFVGELMPIMLYVVAGILMIHDAKLAIGSVVAYLTLVRQLLNAVYELFSGFDQVVMASPSIRAISEILDSGEVENQNPRIANFIIDGSVEFGHVDFSYQSRPGQLQLQDIDISIRPGEKIALVGESGSGKTTFVNALLGLYPIKSGKITFGSHDIGDVSLRQLRSQIAIMSQDTFLFNTSLLDNVRFANLKATDEQVRDACRKAEILEFIEGLPDGFETCAGERGVQLSGGQRQRIGLARVFLRDPRIIILDEPSSSLDVVTEEKLFDTMYRNIGDRTLIIIAHRMSTIKHVDTILVFRNGRIVERGRPVELQVTGGLFSRMVTANLFVE